MSTVNRVETQTPSIPWWLVLIEGIAAIIIGILLFARPAATTLLLIQFLGIYWLITGIFTLISLIWDRTAWGWKLFNGILGILAGVLIIQNPLWSTLLVPATLAIVVGVIGILIGILQLVDAFRGGGWGVGILGGLSILLGLVLIARPVIAGLTLPFVLGGLLLVGGLMAIFGAFGLRSAQQRMRASPASRPMASAPSAPASTPPASSPVPVTGAPAAAPPAAAAVGLAAAGTLAAAEAHEADEAPEEDIREPAAMAMAEPAEADVLDEMVKPEIAADVAEEIPAELPADAQAEISAAALTGNIDLSDPSEMAKFRHELQFVEGIGPVYANKLQAAGLTTCLDLLQAGATRKGREDLAASTGLPGRLILKWVNHVDLYRIKGVGSEYADLLEAAGVDTVVELAQRNPANLTAAINEINLEKALVRHLPTTGQVADWISQAKGLPRVVSY